MLHSRVIARSVVEFFLHVFQGTPSPGAMERNKPPPEVPEDMELPEEVPLLAPDVVNGCFGADQEICFVFLHSH